MSYPFTPGTIFDIGIHLLDDSISKSKVKAVRDIKTTIGKMIRA